MVDRKYRWHVLFVKTNHEKKVNSYIDKFGIESYLPVRKELSYWSDRKKWIEKPMFPGYLFVRVSCKEFFNALNHTSVYHYVCFEEGPAIINEREIDMIRRLEAEKEILITERAYSEGDNVRITEGSLAGISGVIEKIESKSYVLIELPFLSKTVKVKVQKEMVCFASA